MNTTGNLQQIMEANRLFVRNKEYRDYQADKFPDKRMVILTCMDTRLVELLELAMGLSQGHAKMIKVAGAQVHHPFGSVMHSILIAVHMLEADEVYVVGHKDCGMQSVDRDVFIQRMIDRGVSKQTIQMMKHAGHDLDRFLERFDNVYDNVRETVSVIANHPFLKETKVAVHGLVIDPTTGELELVIDGHKAEVV